MDLQASGTGRRQERIPLDTLIELRSDESDDVLEADGLDLGSGGVAMRASFVPPLGARLECQFRCPPDGDPVRAHGEVVWAQAEGHRSGAFGMRFLELDTKSATTIRRLVEPNQGATEPLEEPQHLATMRIDGLGAPIETDVRLYESDRLVLEQELSFLRLGRGVEVEVPGRGRERGRIASVELRHSPLDVPTLVFGVLLDDVREPTAAGSHTSLPVEAGFACASARGSATEEPTFTAVDTWPERPIFADAPAPFTADLGVPPGARLSAADARRVNVTEARSDRARRSEGEQLEFAGRGGVAVIVVIMRRVLSTVRIVYRARLAPAVARVREALGGWLGETLPRLRRLLTQLRKFVSRQWGQLRAFRQARARAQRRTTAPAPRAARPVHGVSRGESERMLDEHAVPRTRRMLAMALAVVGVALGIYALAPRSGADRIPVRRSPTASPEVQALSRFDGAAATGTAATVAGSEHPVRAEVAGPVATTTQAATPDLEVAAPEAPAPGRSFGASAVPNGRTFAIRMSGPVESIEGDQREDGFTVRVPGRLALDRASPIASSHRAVARAMILNRGDYAELTVDFLPGLRPQYQVTANDNAIEVTLERL